MARGPIISESIGDVTKWRRIRPITESFEYELNCIYDEGCKCRERQEACDFCGHFSLTTGGSNYRDLNLYHLFGMKEDMEKNRYLAECRGWEDITMVYYLPSPDSAHMVGVPPIGNKISDGIDAINRERVKRDLGHYNPLWRGVPDYRENYNALFELESFFMTRHPYLKGEYLMQVSDITKSVKSREFLFVSPQDRFEALYRVLEGVNAGFLQPPKRSW